MYFLCKARLPMVCVCPWLRVSVHIFCTPWAIFRERERERDRRLCGSVAIISPCVRVFMAYWCCWEPCSHWFGFVFFLCNSMHRLFSGSLLSFLAAIISTCRRQVFGAEQLDGCVPPWRNRVMCPHQCGTHAGVCYCVIAATSVLGCLLCYCASCSISIIIL